MRRSSPDTATTPTKMTLGHSILIVGLVLLILSLAPGVVGQIFGDYVFFLTVFLLAYYLVTSRGLPIDKRLVSFLLLIVFCIYLIGQTALVAPVFGLNALKTSSLLLVSAGAGLLLAKRSEVTLVLIILVYLVAALSMSQVTTFILLFFVPAGDLLYSSLSSYIRDLLPINNGLTIYFPMTLAVGESSLQNMWVPRAAGLYREPGIYQGIIIISYFAVDYVIHTNRRLLKVLFILSLVTTVSSAGIVLLTISIFYNRFMHSDRFEMKVFMIICGGVAVYVLFMYDILGLYTKLFVSEGSIEWRVGIISVSWDLLLSRPVLGYGLMLFEELSSRGGGVHFFASLHQFGGLGILLYGTYCVHVLRSNYTRRTLVLVIPVVGTFLFSQPLYLMPFTFFMLNLNAKTLDDNLTRRKVHTKRIEAPGNGRQEKDRLSL